MFGSFFAFELRYRLRDPVFWATAVILFAMTFGVTVAEGVQFGSGGHIKANSPYAILLAQMMLAVFFMFVTTSFVANAVVRDDENGFGPIIHATRVSKFDYLIGRFAGAMMTALFAFALVPLGIAAGSLMPWLDPETLGPQRLSYYLNSYLFYVAPTIMLTGAIFFAVATATRSMIYSYASVIGFLVIYAGFDIIMAGEPDLAEFAAIIDPLGISSVAYETRYWTAAELNSQLPPFNGTILINRVLAIVLSMVVLAIAYWRFSFAAKGTSARKLKALERQAHKLALIKPQIAEKLPSADPDRAWLIRLVGITVFETQRVLRSPAFWLLMMVGLANSIVGLVFGKAQFGTAPIPATFLLITSFAGAFQLVPVAVAIYYGGDLVWRDREHKLHEVVDSTSVPGWGYLIPKALAASLVLVITLVIAVGAAISVQVAKDYYNFELGKYLSWYVLPFAADMVLLAILSIFVQALSPNKIVGWGIMVLYVSATIVFPRIGVEHPLILYGSGAPLLLSDLNGNDVAGSLGWWLRLYWGGIAVLLGALAHLIWPRGIETRLSLRLKRLPCAFVSKAGALGAVGAAVSLAVGTFLFGQMNLENSYLTSEDNRRLNAEYEKRYLQYASLKQPSLTDVTLNVDIYPEERRLEASGRFDLINDTGAPVEVIHLRMTDDDSELLEVGFEGAVLKSNDETYQYRIYRLHTPLAPDATTSLTFKTRRWQKALAADGYDTRLVKNGTFLRMTSFAPQIGMSKRGLLSDRAVRRRYDLPPELRPAKLEDDRGRERNYAGNVDWVNSDITISTAADQVAIAPGNRVSDFVDGDRRIARFRSTAPILNRFSIQSARYELAEQRSDGVDLQVYFDPQHPYNVERMLDAMAQSLRYYRANFGPYQFDHARIVEFPGYRRYAQAFAGTVAYSESIGFLANLSDPGSVDYVTYVTAHEIAHQYWANQLMAADQQGATLLIETLAQYSALMVMKELYGEDGIRPFLKYELDSYLKARRAERIEELPLERVEDQSYLHYHKGAVAMYLLQDRLGEARVNAMLSGLLDQYRFKSQPYASGWELTQGMLALARNDQEQDLVRDLLQRIALYDLRADSASVRELGDGTFETTISIGATKFYADGQGAQSTAPLNESIELGLFSEEPIGDGLAAENVITIDLREISSGTQTIVMRSDKRPKWAGIDPYNKYIDRNSEDNLIEVD